MIEIKKIEVDVEAVELSDDGKRVGMVYVTLESKDMFQSLVESHNKWEKVKDYFNDETNNGPIFTEALLELVSDLVTGGPPQTTVGELEVDQKCKLLEPDYFHNDNDNDIWQAPRISSTINQGATTRFMENCQTCIIYLLRNNTPCEIVKEQPCES